MEDLLPYKLFYFPKGFQRSTINICNLNILQKLSSVVSVDAQRIPNELILIKLKWSGSFYKTNIFIVDYTLVSPKYYFAKNLELCGPRNLLFNTAASATKLQFGGFKRSFVALAVALNNKFLGPQSSKFTQYNFGLIKTSWSTKEDPFLANKLDNMGFIWMKSKEQILKKSLGHR